MSDSTSPLGAYLKARRAMVSPADVGIRTSGVRRVAGLRREEVAMLAGISLDYYLRLERGRNRNPSMQVLESLARVLNLDDDHFAHLVSLSSHAPRHRAHVPRLEVPPEGARKLLDALAQPAFIENQYFDVLASNRLARALSPGLAPGRNQLRDLFLDPAEQALTPEWEAMTECFVASLRQAVGNDTADRRFVELTGELSLASDRFRQLWARHEVRGQRGTSIRIAHPLVGEMTLNRERLAIAGTDALMLVVYHPDAGSTDADRLAVLGSAELPVAVRGPRRAQVESERV